MHEAARGPQAYRRGRRHYPCAGEKTHITLVKVWVDFTNSPHVLVLAPVIATLRERGHEVQVTARHFAQTLGLCERLGIDHEPIGRHRGGRRSEKAIGLVDRSLALARWARGGRFDLALGHGSN